MTSTEPTRKLLTLCLVVDGDNILLGKKKRGFGEAKWNGFGGKVHDGETLEVAALRELEEEVGLSCDQGDLKKCAVHDFVYGDSLIHEVHVYLVTRWTGEAGECPLGHESDEMFPGWYNFEQIPYSEMWEDDQYWLPQVLQGHTVQGTFTFDAEQKLVSKEIRLDQPLL